MQDNTLPANNVFFDWSCGVSEVSESTAGYSRMGSMLTSPSDSIQTQTWAAVFMSPNKNASWLTIKKKAQLVLYSYSLVLVKNESQVCNTFKIIQTKDSSLTLHSHKSYTDIWGPWTAALAWHHFFNMLCLFSIS